MHIETAHSHCACTHTDTYTPTHPLSHTRTRAHTLLKSNSNYLCSTNRDHAGLHRLSVVDTLKWRVCYEHTDREISSHLSPRHA